MKRALIATTFLIGCGDGGSAPKVPSHNIEQESARILPLLSTCDGWYSRPNCDLGDSMTLAAAMARLTPEKSRLQIMSSIDDNGRPFRSPRHMKRAHEGDMSEDVASHSFSRDHVVSVLFYTVWTKDIEPLSRIWSYAKDNGMKVCDGSVSQCSLTPAVLDHIGDAFAYCGKSRPWQTHIPGAVNAIVQAVSVPRIDSWQLTLAAEQVLLKAKTQHINDLWVEVGYKTWQKVPGNLFYKYAYLAAKEANKSEFERLSTELAEVMAKWTKPGKQWLWNDQNIGTATGYDLILLADMLQEGL